MTVPHPPNRMEPNGTGAADEATTTTAVEQAGVIDGATGSADHEELDLAFASLPPDSPLRSSCDYIVSNPGKRFRAAVLECAARYGDRPEDPLVKRSTVAIELFHAATLAHDDVIDRGELRRG